MHSHIFDGSTLHAVCRGEQLSTTYIGIKLPNEAGEIVVLEVIGKQVAGKLGRAPDHEGGFVLPPRHNVIGGGVIHEVVGLRQEGRGHRAVAIVGQETGALCAGCIQRQRHTSSFPFGSPPPKFHKERLPPANNSRAPATTSNLNLGSNRGAIA